jgi:hypothetical protein
MLQSIRRKTEYRLDTDQLGDQKNIEGESPERFSATQRSRNFFVLRVIMSEKFATFAIMR